jgi:hypothetical protein
MGKQKKNFIQGAHLKEGSFTRYCKSKGYKGVTSMCINEGKKSKNGRVVKMAVLAKTLRRLPERK